MGLVVGIPPAILKLQQEGLIERALYDALFPNMLFRSEADVDEWPAHTGTEMLFTRSGLMSVSTRPLVPGADPEPQQVPHEQWIARLFRYGNRVDTHMPTSTTAAGDLFLDNVKGLGLNAAQVMNRVTRNSVYAPYISGHTVLTIAGISGDTAINVASVNGFTDVVTTGNDGSVRPVPVSTSNPLAITIKDDSADLSRNVVGFSLVDPDDPLGPGVLYLSASLGTAVAARTPAISSAAPYVYRVGGGYSVDAISSSDIVQFQDLNAAAAILRTNNVLKHEDGLFHTHMPPAAVTQFGSDDLLRRGSNANLENTYYRDAYIDQMYKCALLENNECPDRGNSGALTSTGTLAEYAEDIGGEVVNDSGVRIGRIIITGRGVLNERWLNEDAYVSEAGVTGKIGEFDVANQGIKVDALRTKLIIAAPINATMDKVRTTWTSSTSFAAPSDVSTGGAARYKRAVVIEFALT